MGSDAYKHSAHVCRILQIHIAHCVASTSSQILEEIEITSSERVLKKASLADCRLPSEGSWHRRLEKQLQDLDLLVPNRQDDNPSL